MTRPEKKGDRKGAEIWYSHLYVPTCFCIQWWGDLLSPILSLSLSFQVFPVKSEKRPNVLWVSDWVLKWAPFLECYFPAPSSLRFHSQFLHQVGGVNLELFITKDNLLPFWSVLTTNYKDSFTGQHNKSMKKKEHERKQQKVYPRLRAFSLYNTASHLASIEEGIGLHTLCPNLYVCQPTRVHAHKHTWTITHG